MIKTKIFHWKNIRVDLYQTHLPPTLLHSTQWHYMMSLINLIHYIESKLNRHMNMPTYLHLPLKMILQFLSDPSDPSDQWDQWDQSHQSGQSDQSGQ